MVRADAPGVHDNEAVAVVYVDDVQYTQQRVAIADNALALEVDVNSLSAGLHHLQAMVVTADGLTTQVADSWFVRTNTTTDLGSMKCYYTIDGAAGRHEAGKFSDGTYHFDFDVASLSDGLHNIMCLLTSDNGATTNICNAFFVKEPVGGNGVVAYDYWVNSEAASTKVTLDEKSDPYSLAKLLPVSQQPLRSTSFHFGFSSDKKPYIYAKNDFHVRFFDVSQRYTMQTKSYVDYNTAQEVTGATPLEANTSVTLAKPASNAIAWYTVEAQIGDSLAFMTDKACTMQLFAPSGKEVFSTSGVEATRFDGCHALETGTYYLALHDVTTTKGTDIKLSYTHFDKYVVLDLTPKKVGAKPGSKFYIDLFGNGCDKLKSAQLTNGTATFTATDIAAADMSHAKLKFVLPNSAIALGKYDLKLDFVDEDNIPASLTEAGAITMEEPVEGEARITIRSYPRTARPYPVYIEVENTGNLLIEDIDMCVAYNNIDEIESVTFDDSPVKPHDERIVDNLLCRDERGKVFLIDIDNLYGGATIKIVAGFEAGAHTKFDMMAWIASLDECPEGYILRPVDIYLPGDPNEMHGYMSEADAPYIRQDIEDVYYRIEFENDPEIATSAAHHIVVEDKLDGTKLDLASFKPTSVMFGQTSLVLDGTEQSFVKTVDMRPEVNARNYSGRH